MSQKRVAVWGFAAVISIFLAALILLSGIVAFLALSNYKNIGSLLYVTNTVKSNYIEPVSAGRLVNGAIKGIVESLDDPYSVYLEPKIFKQLTEQISGVFGGVGIVVGMKQDHLTVLAPVKGTPAYKAGIKSGDVITEIDGKKALKINLDTAVSLIKGPAGTKVKLTVMREGTDKPLSFDLKREIITLPTVEGEMIKGTKIAHIRLTQFSTQTSEDLSKTLVELKSQKYQGIILDLRDNPGGELDAAVEVADNFVPPETPIVHIVYRKGSPKVYMSDEESLKVPLVVLVNEGSASASEIVAGAIKDTKAGTLIGTKTFGKGVVQQIYDLPHDAGLKLTIAKYLTPKKHDINKKGIIPDIIVKQPANAKKDVQLDKAIKIIEDKI